MTVQLKFSLVDLATPSWTEIWLQKQVWGLRVAQVLIFTLCDDDLAPR